MYSCLSNNHYIYIVFPIFSIMCSKIHDYSLALNSPRHSGNICILASQQTPTLNVTIECQSFGAGIPTLLGVALFYLVLA